MLNSLQVDRKPVCRIVLMCGAILLLGGCSWLFGPEGRFRDRSLDYQRAETASAIEVVTPNPVRDMEHHRPIPRVSAPLKRSFIPEDADDIPRSQVVLKLAPDGVVELYRNRYADFLRVGLSEPQLVESIGTYWASLGKQIIEIDARESTLELVEGEAPFQRRFQTQWVKGDQLKGKRGFFSSLWYLMKRPFVWKYDWYRFRYELKPDRELPGHQLLVVYFQEQYSSQTPSDTDQSPWQVEGEKKVAVKGATLDFGRYLVEVLEQESPKEEQDGSDKEEAVLVRDGNGYPVLTVSQDFAQAWSGVGLALRKSKIKVEDLNRSLSVYYVDLSMDKRFIETLKELEPKGEASKPEADEQESFAKYEVKLSRLESGIQISVQENDETWAPLAVSEKVLSILKEAL